MLTIHFRKLEGWRVRSCRSV